MTRSPAIDVLRGAAALAVFAHHAPPHVSWGWAGVDLFFVLSGYLITSRLVAGMSLRAFYTRRARRILPLYLLFVAASLLTVGLAPVQLAALLLLGGNLHVQLGLPSVTRVLWSVAVEEHFYLLWPLLTRLQTWALLAVGLWALAAGGRYVAQDLGVAPELYHYLTPFRLDGLLVGALLALGEAHGWSRLVLAAGALFALALLLGAGLAWPSLPLAAALLYALLALGFGALLMGAMEFGLRCAPLQWVGERSYSFYLVHPFALLATTSWPPLAQVLAALAGTAVVADLLWRHVEQPWMRVRVRHVGPVWTFDFGSVRTEGGT